MTNKLIKTARQRSNIYGLLSTIYRTEPTESLLNQLKDNGFEAALSDLGINIKRRFFNRPGKKLIEDLAAEYARLFIGPGMHISPHESIHHERDDGDWGMLWGASTVEVKKFIESAGLQYNPEYSGLPDDISVELEFMQKVTEHEAQAWEEKNCDGVLYCIKIEKRFIREHLVKWIPAFCDKVISEAKLSFYSEMARLTKYFIEFEKKEINKYLSYARKELVLI